MRKVLYTLVSLPLMGILNYAPWLDISPVSSLITPHGDFKQKLKKKSEAGTQYLITPHGDFKPASDLPAGGMSSLITPHGDFKLKSSVSVAVWAEDVSLPLMGILNRLFYSTLSIYTIYRICRNTDTSLQFCAWRLARGLFYAQAQRHIVRGGSNFCHASHPLLGAFVLPEHPC